MNDLIDFLKSTYPALTPDPIVTSNESTDLLPNDYQILNEGDQVIEELPRELILIARKIANLKSFEVSEAWRGGRTRVVSPEQQCIDRKHMRSAQRSILELRQLFDLLSKSHIEGYLRSRIPENHCIQIMHDPNKNTLVYVLITVGQATNHPYGTKNGTDWKSALDAEKIPLLPYL